MNSSYWCIVVPSWHSLNIAHFSTETSQFWRVNFTLLVYSGWSLLSKKRGSGVSKKRKEKGGSDLATKK